MRWQSSVGYGDDWLTTNLPTPPEEEDRYTYCFRLEPVLTPDLLKAIVYREVDDGCEGPKKRA